MPIFILGMPRSGTTLTEQILSAHADVAAGGELELVAGPAQTLLDRDEVPDEAALAAFRRGYLAGIRPLAGGRRFITDKLPHNFRFAGLIAAVLPEARIVHLRRRPQAVCWSNLRQSFALGSLGYADAPADMAAYYRLYDGLMAAWHDRWPGRIHDLDYEALTRAPGTAIPALLSALGLPPDPACLRPEENRRVVQTASLVQVRHGIYAGSSADWERYAPFLDGVFDGLERGQGEPG